MAHPDGCDEELNGKLWLSGANWVKRGRARRACRAASEDIRASLALPPEQMGQRAERAWVSLQTELSQILSEPELKRIASLVEAGCGPE